MSFSINYLSYRPLPFPHDNSENADLLGVFWADADSSGVYCDCSSGCTSCGTDVVYYHFYKYGSNNTSSLDPAAQEIFTKSSSDGQKYGNGFREPTWVLVITWSQVIPYPYSANKYSFEVSMCFTLGIILGIFYVQRKFKFKYFN
jgi:hypothetical protein